VELKVVEEDIKGEREGRRGGGKTLKHEQKKREKDEFENENHKKLNILKRWNFKEILFQIKAEIDYISLEFKSRNSKILSLQFDQSYNISIEDELLRLSYGLETILSQTQRHILYMLRKSKLIQSLLRNLKFNYIYA